MRSAVAVEELDGELLLCDTVRGVVHRVVTSNAPWVSGLAVGATAEVGAGLLVRQLMDFRRSHRQFK